MLKRINAHINRRLKLSRDDLFTSVEKSALRPLPANDYEFAEWRFVPPDPGLRREHVS